MFSRWKMIVTKYFIRKILIILNVEGLSHTWTYMNFKGKINKMFLLIAHLDQYARWTWEFTFDFLNLLTLIFYNFRSCINFVLTKPS